MTLSTFRETLKQSVLQISSSAQSVWAWLQEQLDLSQARPQAVAGIEVSRLEGREGVYYILKNPARRTYFRLSDKDYFLWQRMDGEHTVKDLVVAFFMEYKVLAFGRVSGLLEGLKSQFFLVEQPVNVYHQVGAQLDRRNPRARLTQVGRSLVEKQFAIQGLDQRLSRLYARGGWLFYTRPAQVLWLLVSLAGMVAFSGALMDNRYEVLAIGGNTGLGILSLALVYLLSIFIHELFHALTVKHYRREVPRGGFMIYFGMPTFFVDTSDIWMEGKRARLAVTWAGPYADLVQAGLASLALFLWPEGGISPVLFQFALVTYINVLFNLNPLLELDGYFLLMDGLEIPLLRRKSLEFIRRGAWRKLKTLRAAGKKPWTWPGEFSREERIFSVFGLLAAAWTVYALVQAGVFWQGYVADAAMALFLQSSGLGRAILLALGGALGVGLVFGLGFVGVSLARWVLARAGRAGFFSTPWRKAAWTWGLGLAVWGATLAAPGAALWVALAGLGVGLYFGAVNARSYRGAGFMRVVGGVSLLTWLVAAAGLGLGWVARGADVFTGVAEPVTALLALGMLAALAPSLLDLWHTTSAPAAVTLGLSLLLLAGAAVWGPLALCGYLFLSAGLGLQQVAYRQRVGLRAAPAEVAAPQSDLALLKQSFAWSSANLRAQFVKIGGPGRASQVERQFNHYARAAAWPVFLAADGVIDTSPPAWGLRQLGNSYAVALNLLLDLMMAAIGENLTVRALQGVYDAMPWEMRELAGLHLFPEVRRAQAVHQQFQAEQQTYRALLRRIPLFAALSQEEIDRICARLRTEKFGPGQVIIREGDRGDKFYIVARGSVQVEQGPAAEIVNRHERGGYFGQVALLNDAPRNATCRAVTPVEVVALNRTDFDQLVKVCFDLREKVQDAIARVNLLRQIPLFADVDERQLYLIGAQMGEERIEAGTVIIRQGEIGETFYVIESGRVQVRVASGQSERVVNERGPGEYFGEIALLLKAPRNATLQALTPVHLFTLNQVDFDRLVVPQLYASRVLEQEMSRRMLQLQRAIKTD